MKTVLINVPYPVGDTSDGVNYVAQDQRKYLPKYGYRAVLVGPRDWLTGITGTTKDKADYNIGIAIPISVFETNMKAGFLTTKMGVEEILEKVKPDLILLHEIIIGTSAHSVITAANNFYGKKRPPIIAQFHAQKEGILKKAQLIKNTLKKLKRPEIKRYGQLTPGYANTGLKNLDASIAISQATASFVKKVYELDNIEVIPNGIDTEFFRPTGPRKKSWLRDGKKIILFTGRHDERKGIDDLIKAFKQIKKIRDDLKLIIVGEGVMTPDLKQLVSDLSLNDVHFVDPLPRKDLPKALRTAAEYGIVVAPSKGGEGFGLVPNEALACGALVVATDIAGYRQSLGFNKYPFARLAKAGNPASLAKEILFMLNLPEKKRKEYRAKARQFEEKNHSMDKNIYHLAKFFDKILACRK